MGYGRHLFAELLDGRPLLGQLGRDHQVVAGGAARSARASAALPGSASSSSISARMSRAATGCGSVVTEIRNRPSPAA